MAEKRAQRLLRLPRGSWESEGAETIPATGRPRLVPALGQRSQRRPTWEKLGALFDRWLPAPRVVQEFPDARFRASRLKAARRKHGSVRGVAGNGHPYRDGSSFGAVGVGIVANSFTASPSLCATFSKGFASQEPVPLTTKTRGPEAPPKSYRRAFSIAPTISAESGFTGDSNRAITLPLLSTKNLVKFHLISPPNAGSVSLLVRNW